MNYIFLFTKRKCKVLLFALTNIFLLYIFGAFHHPFERNFFTEFHYPFDGDIERFVAQLRQNQTPEVKAINNYSFYYYKDSYKKCQDVTDLRLVYIVKSAPGHFRRRLAIRSTWGFQKRFSDVEIRTVFLVGITNDPKLQKLVNDEYQKFNDIVQANYTDHYYNNTYKTMSGFYWVMKYCPNSKFYMFMDDDFYASTKNILRYLRFPTNYPGYLQEPLAKVNAIISGKRLPLQAHMEFELEDDVRLYTGYAFNSAPHRHLMGTWYVSLKEYPYHMYPPYVTGGSYILSNAALKDMYFASFYTKHFRFDDIYISILAYKTKIEPLHSEEFYFFKKAYHKVNYEYVVASHGYDNPEELMIVWNEQKSLGNA